MSSTGAVEDSQRGMNVASDDMFAIRQCLIAMDGDEFGTIPLAANLHWKIGIVPHEFPIVVSQNDRDGGAIRQPPHRCFEGGAFFWRGPRCMNYVAQQDNGLWVQFRDGLHQLAARPVVTHGAKLATAPQGPAIAQMNVRQDGDAFPGQPQGSAGVCHAAMTQIRKA